jgi:hypothetical protein
MTRFALLALLVQLGACSPHAIKTQPVVRGADALWGGASGFCARTPAGLSCWSEAHGRFIGPTVVPGIAGVVDVAIGIGKACVLGSDGVTCFRPGETASTRVALDHPAQLIELEGSPTLTCARDAAGVTCWGSHSEPARMPNVGTPQRIFESIDHALCGTYDDGVQCFPVDPKTSNLGAAVLIANAKSPSAVLVDTIGGSVFALEDGVVKFGQFGGTLHVTGNPFASSDPLAVPATVTPFVGARVTVDPIPGLGHVTAMVSRLFPIVLDEHGLTRVDYHSGWDLQKRPADAVPSALWAGARGEIYTREGDELHQHRPASDHVVTDVHAPTNVIATLGQTCALAASGDVACWDSPRDGVH